MDCKSSLLSVQNYYSKMKNYGIHKLDEKLEFLLENSFLHSFCKFEKPPCLPQTDM